MAGSFEEKQIEEEYVSTQNLIELGNIDLNENKNLHFSTSTAIERTLSIDSIHESIQSSPSINSLNEDFASPKTQLKDLKAFQLKNKEINQEELQNELILSSNSENITNISINSDKSNNDEIQILSATELLKEYLNTDIVETDTIEDKLNIKENLLAKYESDALTDIMDDFVPESKLKKNIDIAELSRNQPFFTTENVFDQYRKNLNDRSWNPLITWTFVYLLPLLWTSNRSNLNELGVPKANKDMTATYNYNKGKKKLDSSKGKLIIALVKLYFFSFAHSFFYRLVNDLLYYAGPYLLNYIIIYVKQSQTDNPPPLWWGLLLSFGMLIVPIVQTLFIHRYFTLQGLNIVKISSFLQAALYRKSLLLAPEERSRFSTGEIVNLQTIDVEKVAETLGYWTVHAFTVPISLTLALYFTFTVIGWSTFAGVATIAILLPLDGIVGKWVAKYANLVLSKKDSRSKLVSAMIHGIRVIKYYASENLYLDLISKARFEEYKKLRIYFLLLSIQEFITAAIPLITSLATFGVYQFVGGDLSAEKLFTALSLLTTMRLTIRIVPEFLMEMINAFVSLNRIILFLNAKEIQKMPHLQSKSFNDVDEDIVYDEKSSDYDISFKNASFKWNSTDKAPILSNINLDIKKGELMSIIGPVGSGKSTLIHSVFGDTILSEGKIVISNNANIAYCPQQPWIVNATFRENITMDLPYDENKYNEVIRVCALLPDLETMPAGSDTEISSFGTTLSGGQKARLSLARACYRDADIYLLDCPLSAVDREVAYHIYEECIRGFLRSKTIILVTHNLQLLSQSDSITIMEKGSIKISGSYTTLMRENADFSNMIKIYVDDKKIMCERPIVVIDNNIKDILIDQNSISVSENNNHISGVLTKKETLKEGLIGFGVYIRYLLGFTIPMLILILIFGGLSKVLETGMDAWMAAFNNESIYEILKNLGVYAGFAFGAGLINLLFNITFFQGSLWSSNSMHNRMMKRLLHATISFYDETPSGAILNRCSSDQNSADQFLPTNTYHLIIQVLILLSVLVIIAYAFPLFLISLIPISISFYIVQRVYRNVSRQLARLRNNAKTPLLSNINSCLEGVSTIRAHNYLSNFHSKHDILITEYCNYHLLMILTNRWVGVRMESVSALVIFLASIASVLFSKSVSPAIVGLSLSYSLTVTRTFYRIISYFASMESSLVSVERIEEFSNIEQEAEFKFDKPKVQDNWPNEGKIEFKNIKMRYRPTLDYSLKNLSIEFESGKKTAIVGRSGSGKSTIIQCLLRIVEISKGSIIIDGVDISKIGLHELRERIAIIPQHPFIFHGTLRFNVDPFNKYSDFEIWNALEKVRMKSTVESMEYKLDQQLEEGGQGLSIGQQQLLCIARVLLRDCKIILCDEATSSVSQEDDVLINKILNEAFQGRTMIIISHRIHTIVNDVDKVLVMKNARCIEYGTPQELLNNPDSAFSKLVIEE